VDRNLWILVLSRLIPLISLPPKLHPHDLQVPALDLYHLLAEINIDIKDVAYAIDRLTIGLRTVRYNRIVVR